MESEIREPAFAYGKSRLSVREYLTIEAFRINQDLCRELEDYKTLPAGSLLSSVSISLPVENYSNTKL